MRSRGTKIAFAALVGLSLLAAVFYFYAPGAFFSKGTETPKFRAGPSTELDLGQFFNAYWQRPIPLQGAPPSFFSDKESSLGPDACGSCHAQQYADWKESLHSRAMGPGPWGQIIDLTKQDPAGAISCMTCHAPLSEQSPQVAKAGDADGTLVANGAYDPQLQLRGITCAACHVRGHQRFGPPKAEGNITAKYPAGLPNHGGVQRTPYFERAEFCKDCHQFDPEYSLLVNGKPIQDTFREWQSSSWGKAGAACQSCHMPERRHLWRGIHDREWVKGAVRVEQSVEKNGSGAEGKLRLNLHVINAAVGHKFPTYLTPKIFVRAELLDQSGKALPRTTQEGIIGWDARFEDGEWKEYFDTRVAPGERFSKVFQWQAFEGARKIRAWVEVHPDHFYHVHFYPPYLQGSNLSADGRGLIERALRESGESVYVLYENIVDL
ncbi:MAG: ammonia-forming cytochrome c nitrite reductase subunit c552 [Deltaproteobacteria bacterium]|nr:ammonia-forming cytochrome c nitrite reductase subunit c552 [Deltaproteobacteria bacterium]